MRKPGKRFGKVSPHYYNGIFIQYAKRMRNFVYIDTNTKRIETSSHEVFNEAHHSQSTRPHGAQISMERAYTEPLKEDE